MNRFTFFFFILKTKNKNTKTLKKLYILFNILYNTIQYYTNIYIQIIFLFIYINIKKKGNIYPIYHNRILFYFFFFFFKLYFFY